MGGRPRSVHSSVTERNGEGLEPRYCEVVDCPSPERRWLSLTQTPISTSAGSWPGKLIGSPAWRTSRRPTGARTTAGQGRRLTGTA